MALGLHFPGAPAFGLGWLPPAAELGVAACRMAAPLRWSAAFAYQSALAWLDGGVDIKAVADLLGHSSISITGDVYGHTSDATTRRGGGGPKWRFGLH